MRVLFVHNTFPAQFVHLARALVQQGHEVLFVVECVNPHVSVDGAQVTQVTVPPLANAPDGADDAAHPDFAMRLAMHKANAFGNVFLHLRTQGFCPDLIIDHPAWGSTFYVQDIFPYAARVCYFEWYFTKVTQSIFSGHQYISDPALFGPTRQRNLFLLQALQECHWGIVPTAWQCRQIPANFHYKLQVLHEGIPTERFCPAPNGPKKTITVGDEQGTVVLSLPSDGEVVTYVSRGFEPYRGFPQFYGALEAILAARPHCQVLIIGEDKVCYDTPRADGKGWAAYLRETKPLSAAAAARVHFLPYVSGDAYVRLLRASTVHVYLTVPFIVSWSLLEAMSCGALVVCADTMPVREVVEHGISGFLTDMNSPNGVADAVIAALENAPQLDAVRRAAREVITSRYDAETAQAQALAIVTDVLRRL